MGVTADLNGQPRREAGIALAQFDPGPLRPTNQQGAGPLVDPGDAHQLAHSAVVECNSRQCLIQFCQLSLQPVQLIQVPEQQIAFCPRQRR